MTYFGLILEQQIGWLINQSIKWKLVGIYFDNRFSLLEILCFHTPLLYLTTMYVTQWPPGSIKCFWLRFVICSMRESWSSLIMFKVHCGFSAGDTSSYIEELWYCSRLWLDKSWPCDQVIRFPFFKVEWN